MIVLCNNDYEKNIKGNVKKVKKLIDKSIVLMYNNFCVTKRRAIVYW